MSRNIRRGLCGTRSTNGPKAYGKKKTGEIETPSSKKEISDKRNSRLVCNPQSIQKIVKNKKAEYLNCEARE